MFRLCELGISSTISVRATPLIVEFMNPHPGELLVLCKSWFLLLYSTRLLIRGSMRYQYVGNLARRAFKQGTAVNDTDPQWARLIAAEMALGPCTLWDHKSIYCSPLSPIGASFRLSANRRIEVTKMFETSSREGKLHSLRSCTSLLTLHGRCFVFTPRLWAVLWVLNVKPSSSLPVGQAKSLSMLDVGVLASSIRCFQTFGNFDRHSLAQWLLGMQIS